MRNKAFTLAEVLITLGIIGVVAAITIPALITTHQKKVTVTKLKKAISILNQAYRLSFDDNGDASAQEAMDMGTVQYFNTYWAPYIKTATLCKGPTTCNYKSNFPFKVLNGTTSNSGFGGFNPASKTTSRVPFLTSDGFLYIIHVYGGSGQYDENGNMIQVAVNEINLDINGFAGPNTYGKDVFILRRIYEEGKGPIVVPNCYDSSLDTINQDCSKTGAGSCCAEKIRRASWEIDKSYPW